MYSFTFGVWVSLALAGLACGHIAPFVPAMYCINGTDPTANPLNNNAPVQPLYNLTYADFWMHHSNGCDEYPPEPGVFLELTAGGTFTVELAGNRADTSLNPLAVLTDWGDGLNHPDDYTGNPCIFQPNLHTQNQSMAAGTAWGISYESDITKVTPNNLVVFSVLYHTPWKRIATYQVPPGMPACPEEGCICTWLWIPNGCGIPNMYMFPYKCKVVPDSSPKTIGNPQPPVWCEDDESKCVTGPKQMLIWHQLDSNNIEVEGYDLHGDPKSPAYNMKCGFQNGPQLDIFVDSSSSGLDVASTTTGSSALASSAASDSPASSSTPAGSATPTDPEPLAASPAVFSSFSTSSLPAGSGTLASPLPLSSLSGSDAPVSPPPLSFPSGSRTPAVSPPFPASNLPAGSGTPPSPPSSFLPSGSAVPSFSNSNYPPWSGVPTGSYTPHWWSSGPTDTCTSSSSQSTAGDRRAVHAKRMLRERRAVF